MEVDAGLMSALERLLFPEGGRGRACLASRLHQIAKTLELEEAGRSSEPLAANGGAGDKITFRSALRSAGAEAPASCSAAGAVELPPERAAAQELVMPCSEPAACPVANKQSRKGRVP